MTTPADDAARAIEIAVDVIHDSLVVDVDLVRRSAAAVLAGEGVSSGYVGLVLAGSSFVQDLNRRYLDHDYPTDVLSFPLSGENTGHPGARLEGEVYVDLDTARDQCTEFGETFENEVCRYVIHGVLHLVGYADGTPDEQNQMRALENQYLAVLRGGSPG